MGIAGSAVGSILLAIGLFKYDKLFMYRGAFVISTGNIAIVVAFLILLTESVGDAFAFIFTNIEVVLIIIALILMFAGAIGSGAVPKEYFGIFERFSTFSAVGFNAVLGVYLFKDFNNQES